MKYKVARWILLSIVAVLLLVHFPLEARAEDTEYSGFCGVDLTWMYDGEGTLTISGNGAMYHFYNNGGYPIPWSGLPIRSVVIEPGATSIGNYAFYKCTMLTTVTIPDSVTSIGDCAFYYCGKLTSVTIPDSVTNLGDSVFYENINLKEVTIGKGVTGIGEKAFYNCCSLTSVTIPDRVTSVGEKAFWSCDALTTVTIGDGVASIGINAFAECGTLNSVTLGDNVCSIEGYAFYKCPKLTSITIPSSVTKVGGCAFYGCTSLTSVCIEDATAAILQDAFADCTNLVSVALGSHVTEIGSAAFENCGKLKEIVIPDSVAKIGEGVFSGCGSLENITIPFVGPYKEETIDLCGYTFGYFFGTKSYPGGLEIQQTRYSLGEWIYTITENFYFPRLLTSVTITGGVIPTNAFEKIDWLRFVYLGDSVTGIGEGAFRYCDSLTSIIIPDSVTSIEAGAFYSCSGLTSAVIGNGVTKIGRAAFERCGNMNSVSIGSSVVTIGDSAFMACVSLTSVTIPDSVTDIYYDAFYGCAGLTSVTLGDGLITIDRGVFKNCSSLMSLTIPEKVISIGDEALNGCKSLITVIIGSDVRTIGRKVFDNSPNLDHVLYTDTQEQWNRNIGLKFFHATLHVDVNGDEVERRETEFGTYYYCTVCEKLLWNDGQVLFVEIQTLPQKLEYFGKRDTLDLTGGVVQVRMADGRIITKPMSELTVSGFDNTVPGECLLTVTVVDKTKTFPVKITTATVTFLDHDGTVIEQGEYMYGDTVRVPTDPVREEENGVTYTFSGWDKPITAVEGDAVYTAVYFSEKIPYTVEFLSHDGTVISSGSYYYGDAVEVPEAPTKEPGIWNHYEFIGWSSEITVCRGNATYSPRYKDIPHDYYKGEITAPTCTERGYTTFICACGKSYEGDYVASSGHSMGRWMEHEAATCTQTGLERRECMACEYYETRKSLPTGHDYELVVTDPTCTVNGYTTHICDCGDSYVDTYRPSLGHSWDDGMVVIEPTEEAEGVKRYTCTVCGETKTESIDALDHVHVYTETVVAPTCTRSGYVLCSCPCGDSYVSNYVAAVGHRGAWFIEREPVNGVGGMYRTCDVCGEAEYADFEMPLTDVPNGKYFSKPVYWAYVNGITKGKTTTQFQRDAECTRKQIVMFLWRAAGQPEPQSMENPFEDVKDDSFRKAILWAYGEGITSGKTATEFRPEDPCTRDQIVMFLWRYFGEPEPQSMENPFSDVNVGSTFEKAILWAFYEGITTGKTATTFEPKATCTRGQIVTFLYRAMVDE